MELLWDTETVRRRPRIETFELYRAGVGLGPPGAAAEGDPRVLEGEGVDLLVTQRPGGAVGRGQEGHLAIRLLERPEAVVARAAERRERRVLFTSYVSM